MHIEIHGFNAVFHGVSKEDVVKLCDDILKIKYDSFVINENKDTSILKYAFGRGKRSVYIRVYIDSEKSYIALELKGSFFDNSPKFRLRKLLKFMSDFKYTPKQLDVAFNDDKKCIPKELIERWCTDSDEFCTGNLVRRLAPGILTRKRGLDRIQLGEASSKANFGTIYWRPETNFMRIEIKFKDKHKINYILKNYSRDKPQQFHRRSKEALVDCINFVTVQSKKNRVASKYKKQKHWAAFLESEVKRINWRKINAKRNKNRLDSDETTITKRAACLKKQISNFIARSKSKHSEEYLLGLIDQDDCVVKDDIIQWP